MSRIRNDIDNKHTHTHTHVSHTHPIRLLSVYVLLPVNSPIAVIVEDLNTMHQCDAMREEGVAHTMHQCGKRGFDASMRGEGVRIRQPWAHSTSERSPRVHHVQTQALYIHSRFRSLIPTEPYT